jgi:hypothetical protein
MSVVVRRYLGRSRLAEELVEDVLIVEHKNAMFARDVEELVVECLELEKMSKNTWHYVLDQLFSDERTNDIDGLGQAMKTASSKVDDVFGRVGNLIKIAKRDGYSIKDEADFLCACRVIKEIKADVDKKFPPIDEEMMEKSIKSYKVGAYRTAEELLLESQGQGS